MKPFDENRIDEVFRSKLGNFSEIPPDQVLGKIKKTMSQGPAPSTPWFAKYWMFFAVTGITGLVIVSLSFMNAGDNVQASSNQPVEMQLPDNGSDDLAAVENNQVVSAEQSTSEVKSETAVNTVEYSTADASENTIKRESDVNSAKNVNTEKSAGLPQPLRKPQDISVNINVTNTTCRNANGEISLTAPAGQRYYYYWSDINENISMPSRTKLMANTYTVRVVSEEGAEKSYNVSVKDSGTVVSLFGHYEVSSAAGIPIYFDNKSKYCGQPWENSGAVSFLWYFGDGTTSTADEPEHTYQKEGSYVVSLVSTSMMGCRDSIWFKYLNVSGSEMDVPNVITPNNDGINDFFKPEITGIVQHKCTIFSRSGEEVYGWQGTDGQWDGKVKRSNDDAAAGVYYYIIEGTGSDGHKITKTGFVQLFR